MKLLWQNKSQESLKHLKPIARRYIELVTQRFQPPFDEVSITLVSRRAMKQMNQTFRGFNTPTDVLTFPGENGYMGDIVICYPVVVEKAIDEQMTTEEYFRFTVVHGLLHALGYDHQTPEEYETMMKLQEEIINQGVV
jgi:probable rRNA maturation factor